MASPNHLTQTTYNVASLLVVEVLPLDNVVELARDVSCASVDEDQKLACRLAREAASAAFNETMPCS